MRQGSVVGATIIAAPTSTKNQDGKRDPEMHQAKTGNQPEVPRRRGRISFLI